MAEPSSLNWAALAIPVFLGGVVVEAWLARRRGRSVHHLGTSMSDIACGTTFQALEMFLNLLAFAGFAWLYEHARLIEFPTHSPWPLLIALVGVDFAFYWWHRASHVVNLLWAVHGVHHQSEDYNLAVALRQPAFEPLTWFLFYAPLALLGVPLWAYLASYALNRLYQYWIHTELVDRMGPWAEAILNTPSHHRVHHGVEDEYLDKNYGAILIVWDRLFGTFEPERRRPSYGTTIPLRSYNPVWANVALFARIVELARAAPTWRQAAWAWLAHPAWLPTGVPEPPKPDRASYRKYRPQAEPLTALYAVVQFGLALGPMFGFFLYEPRLGALELLSGAGWIIATVTSVAALLERRPWAVRLEPWRVLAGAVLVLVIGRHILPPVALVPALVLWTSAAAGTWAIWRRATPAP